MYALHCGGVWVWTMENEDMLMMSCNFSFRECHYISNLLSDSTGEQLEIPSCANYVARMRP
jgi:hypothetical protein